MGISAGRRVVGIPVLVGLAVVVLNAALWALYRSARGQLEAELGRRLENVAAVLGHTLDPLLLARLVPDSTDGPDVARATDSTAVSAYDSLRRELLDIAEASELANLRLFDASGLAVFDLSAGSAFEGAPEPLDPAGVFAALAGTTTHSSLYQSGHEFLMAGYAPIVAAAPGAPAVVAVDADARFFGALRRLRFAMVASGLLSVAVLIGLGFTFARFQASLRQAEAAMQRSATLAAMGRMAAGIAHEIRNPLGIIKATNARLRKRYEPPESPDERFGYIDEEVDRLNGILTSYLQFARDEPLQLVPLDLAPFLERALAALGAELERARVELALRLPGSCWTAADAGRLRQVVLNIVLNAVEALPAGGRLEVALAAVEPWAELTFTDSGPGIDPDLGERLFEPFVTTKEKGGGLGLAIARRIVQQHGGRIEAGNAPGGGARLRILLPLAPPPGPR